MSERNRKWLVRVFAAAMALLLLVSAVAPVLLSASAATVSELQQNIDQLKKEQEQIEAQLADVKNERDQQAKYLTTLRSQVSNTETQIDLYNQQIAQVNGEIETLEAEIEQINQEKADTIERFKQRVRSAYMGEDPSLLTVLTSSQEFSDVLISAEFMENASAYDDEIVRELKAALEELDIKRLELNAKKEELQAKKDELAVKQAELESQRNEVASIEASLANDEAALKAESQRLLEEQWANQAEIEKIIAANENNNDTDYVGGEFIWPVGGSTYVSSKYGWRYIQGIHDYHTGIDITGGSIYGRNIMASNSGRVVYVRNYSSGYGLHLLIDHGGGKYTLYAHTSAILVKEGDWVSQGQVIARVGSTGWSTGPHLHFEIWVNGQHTDPLAFF